MTHRIAPLDRFLESDEPVLLSPAVLNLLAERLQESLQDSHLEPLQELNNQLVELIELALRKAPEGMVAEVSDPEPVLSKSNAAFSLGQIAFAQAAASIATRRRTDDEFVELLKSEVGKKLASALLESELSSGTLAEALDVRPETISRTLGRFREVGICDFRKDGTTVYNFLTPAARGLAEAMNLRARTIPKPNKQAKLLLGPKIEGLNDFWKAAPNFAFAEFNGDAAELDAPDQPAYA